VIYVDCDKRLCLDEIKNRYPYPTLVVRTSQGSSKRKASTEGRIARSLHRPKGRYQVYWRLNEFVTVKEMEHLMRAIARDIDADIAATDVSRVLRLPNFWNRKPERNNTVDIVFRRDHAVSYKSLSLSLSSDNSDSSLLQEANTSTQAPQRVLECSFDEELKQDKELSESERDWYLIHRWLACGRERDGREHALHGLSLSAFMGVSPDECIQRIISRRQGHKRNVVYYARYSVEKAVRIRAELKSVKNLGERRFNSVYI